MLKRLLFRWVVNFLGLWVAAELFAGISYGDKLRVLIIASLIFAIVNSLVRPLVVLLSLPAILVTFGIFMLVVNTLMLYITSFFYHKLHVDSIWSAIGAVLIIWFVNFLMTDLFGQDKKTKQELAT